MAYNIAFKKSVYKDLTHISKKGAKTILDKIDRELPEIADKLPTLKGKFKGMHRYRIGNYRVIYIILEQDVLILRIYHRKDVYK